MVLAKPDTRHCRFLASSLLLLTLHRVLLEHNTFPRPTPPPAPPAPPALPPPAPPTAGSRDTVLLTRPGEVTTLLVPPRPAFPGPPGVLVVVCSAVGNFAARQTIRESWGRDQQILPGVRVLFLIGRLHNASPAFEVRVYSGSYAVVLPPG